MVAVRDARMTPEGRKKKCKAAGAYTAASLALGKLLNVVRIPAPDGSYAEQDESVLVPTGTWMRTRYEPVEGSRYSGLAVIQRTPFRARPWGRWELSAD